MCETHKEFINFLIKRNDTRPDGIANVAKAYASFLAQQPGTSIIPDNKRVNVTPKGSKNVRSS